MKHPAGRGELFPPGIVNWQARKDFLVPEMCALKRCQLPDMRVKTEKKREGLFGMRYTFSPAEKKMTSMPFSVPRSARASFHSPLGLEDV